MGAILSTWSRFLDFRDTIALGLSADIWLIIGLALFFVTVILMLVQFSRRMPKASTKGTTNTDLIKTEGDIQRQPHQYIPETYIKGRIVYLMDLLPPGAEPIVLGRTIEDCEIRGPAMIALLGAVTITHSGFDGDLESLFIEIAENRMIFGAIALKDCVFRRCHFVGIGILGTKEQIQEAKQGFTQSTSHKEGSQT